MKKLLTNPLWKNTGILWLFLSSVELIFRLIIDFKIEAVFLRILLSNLIISLLLSLLSSFFKKKITRIYNGFWLFLVTVYAIAQLGFESYIGIFMSFKTSSQLGAVTSYIKDYLSSFSWKFYLVAIPFFLYVLACIFYGFYKKNNKKEELFKNPKENWMTRGIALVLILLLCVLYKATLTMDFMQNELQLDTAESQFKTASNPSISVYEFGTTVFAILDIKTTIFPVEEEIILENVNPEVPIDVEDNYTREIDDTAWRLLIENTTNADYKKINEYLINRTITPKNEYTGMFKGKNLIVIMMESTNDIIKEHPEYFPTFNKLYTEGYSWENSYSPRNNCSTGNNEMSGMTSLFTINNTCTAKEYKRNIYNESIFGLFNNEGYKTTSYHNYTEQYYPRSTIHKGMGSSKYYGVDDLNIPWKSAYEEWPSDVDLIEKSFTIFSEDEPFFAWITSVTAHQPYYQSSTEGDRYLDLFKDTNYPTTLKRYLSKLKVFDNALKRLLELLEEKNLLDDTVIVLYGDHYPYGLNNSAISPAVSYDITKNGDIDKTPFVIYNSTIENGRTFTEYTSFMNIVPTLANLFDLDYDPRLYMGTDLLSETYENRVIFADGSWQTPIAYYSAGSGSINYLTEERYTKEEIQAINKDVKSRISMSNLAIKTNYFKYLYEGLEKYKQIEEEPEKGTE